MPHRTAWHVKAKKTTRFRLLAVTIALTGITVLPSATAAGREIWFLGIGNDGFLPDVQGLHERLSAWWTSETVHSRLLEDRSGPEVLSDLTWLHSAGSGDLAVFCYSGHGAACADDDGDEAAGWAEDIYEETLELLSGPGCTDDALADALGGVTSDATVLTIADTCYSGGWVGGTQDLNRLDNILFMGACGESESAYGGYPYSAFSGLLIDGLATGLPADSDSNGVLTFEEWFGYAAVRIDDQTPVQYVHSPGAGAYPVIPEPMSVSLVAFGAAAMVFARRRAAGTD